MALPPLANVNTELPRRFLHAMAGVVIASSGVLLPRSLFLPLLLLAAFFFVLMDIVRSGFPRFNAWFRVAFRTVMRKGETSRITGASYYAIASAVAFLSFAPAVAAASIGFLAIGDPVSGIIGAKGGRSPDGYKGMPSCLGCLGACLTVGLLAHFSLGLAIPIVVAGAVAATLVEYLPLPVNDNLSIPVVAGGVMALAGLLL